MLKIKQLKRKSDDKSIYFSSGDYLFEFVISISARKHLFLVKNCDNFDRCAVVAIKGEFRKLIGLLNECCSVEKDCKTLTFRNGLQLSTDNISSFYILDDLLHVYYKDKFVEVEEDKNLAHIAICSLYAQYAREDLAYINQDELLLYLSTSFGNSTELRISHICSQNELVIMLPDRKVVKVNIESIEDFIPIISLSGKYKARLDAESISFLNSGYCLRLSNSNLLVEAKEEGVTYTFKVNKAKRVRGGMLFESSRDIGPSDIFIS